MGGAYGEVSLSDGVIEYAKTHEELKGAFLTFQKDADQIYPGWKEKLGYTGESSVQAATFDWQKKAAAAAFVGASAESRKQSVAMKVDYSGYAVQGDLHFITKRTHMRSPSFGLMQATSPMASRSSTSVMPSSVTWVLIL